MGSAFKNLFKKESSTEDEIKQLVEEDEQVGQLEKNQREMINNIFEFDDLDAGDIMTHRIDINALDCNLSIEKAVELAIEYGNSRLPVYDEDLDRICGVLYVKDLLKFVGKPISNGEKLLSYTRKPLFVPESMPCGKLFAKMTEASDRLRRIADFDIDGEMQFDCAVSEEVAKLKAPESKVAGHANTFIFPNLSSGNIGYKIAARLGGYEAVGPILQGLNAPINDLSRGCTSDEIYKMAIVTAAQKDMDI